MSELFLAGYSRKDFGAVVIRNIRSPSNGDGLLEISALLDKRSIIVPSLFLHNSFKCRNLLCWGLGKNPLPLTLTGPGARFSKGPVTFRARNQIFKYR